VRTSSSGSLEKDGKYRRFAHSFEVPCTETLRNGSAQKCWGHIQQHWMEVPAEQALLPHSSVQMVVPVERGRKTPVNVVAFVLFILRCVLA